MVDETAATNEIPLTPGQLGYQELKKTSQEWDLIKDDAFGITRRKVLPGEGQLETHENKKANPNENPIRLTCYQGKQPLMAAHFTPEGLDSIVIHGVDTKIGGVRFSKQDISLAADRMDVQNRSNFRNTAQSVAELARNMVGQNKLISPSTLITVASPIK